MRELVQHTDHVNELLARYGVKFGIYKNNVFKEQLFPFDAIPRVIEFEEFEKLEDNRNYADLLRTTMNYVNTGGHNVILTSGRYNAAYFEHSYLAEKTEAHLVNGSELMVEDDKLYYLTASGKKEQVGAVYRRISDEYLDPMNFNPDSLIGIPHIYDVFRKGNVALLNAPGNFVPHVRLMEEGYSKTDIASQFGMPYIVVRKVRPYDTTTLNYNWQVWNTQAFSLYTTATEQIDPNGAGQAVLSILNFCASQGIVRYQGPSPVQSKVVIDTDLVSVRTSESGIFEPLVKTGEHVTIGQPLANIIHPYESELLETLYAPVEGKVFFIHNEPLTYANTAVIKLVQ